MQLRREAEVSIQTYKILNSTKESSKKLAKEEWHNNS